MLRHARQALPSEAVGILGGDVDGRVQIAIPLPNLAGYRGFVADPLAQYRAERTLSAHGLAQLGVYHSHPGGGVQLSPLDCSLASPTVQVVIALGCEHHVGAEIRAYRVSGGSAAEVAIRIA